MTGKESKSGTSWPIVTDGNRNCKAHRMLANSDTAMHNGRNAAYEEELVDTGDEDRPDDAYEPGAESVDGHFRVVSVRDGGANLRVGRVVLELDRVGVEVRVLLIDVADGLDLQGPT